MAKLLITWSRTVGLHLDSAETEILHSSEEDDDAEAVPKDNGDDEEELSWYVESSITRWIIPFNDRYGRII